MPYEVLPAQLRALIPSESGQWLFRNVFNAQIEAGKPEPAAFAAAWAALRRAGYRKGSDGLWRRKEAGNSVEKRLDAARIIKLDGERRIAWGWAYVSTVGGETVVDRQGDVIPPAEMERMADRFMASARMAKAMHDGEGIGEVLHSLPLTKELADALGIACDREGWIIGMRINDDRTWEAMKAGHYAAFSIGGRGKRRLR